MAGEEMAVLRRHEEARDSAGASLLQRWVRLRWLSGVVEYCPVFQEEKAVFNCNRQCCIDYRHG